jgi:diguanylate cyclase
MESVKIKLFKKTDIFSKYTEEELNIISKYSDYKKLKKGESLFNPGDPGDALYIIINGGISILKRVENNKEIQIAEYKQNHCFGELDLLTSTKRNAISRAETETKLLYFPKKGIHFEDVLKKHPTVSAKILHHLLVLIAERLRKANSLIKDNSPLIQELRKQVYIDKPTGLYNKTFLEEKLGGLLQDREKPLSILSVKPDNFKYINDLFGHKAGDEAIKILGLKMKEIVKDEEMLCRFLGNEMFVILPDSGREKAFQFAEMTKRILNGLSFNEITKERPFVLSVSIGISVFPEHAENKETLIDKAHELPLIGRARGGNKILFPEDK